MEGRGLTIRRYPHVRREIHPNTRYVCLNFAITQHLHGGRSDRVIKLREAPARSRQLPSRFVVLSAGNCPPATGWIRADTSRHRYDGSRLIVRSWREVDRRRGYTARRTGNRATIQGGEANAAKRMNVRTCTQIVSKKRTDFNSTFGGYLAYPLHAKADRRIIYLTSDRTE